MRDINGDRAMPGPREWFEWLASGDERHRHAAIVGLAARSALLVHERKDMCGLTAFGVASAAASCAVVLADPGHRNHEATLARLTRDLA